MPPMCRLFNLVSTLSCVSLAAAWTTFVLPHSSGGDDTPGINAAFSANKALAKDATIVFKKGVTYNIATPLTFPQFQNVLVSIQGNITYAADIAATQASVRSSSYQGHWFTFPSGTNVTLEGSQDPNWGWVNANGQKWWDAMQQISSQVDRPFGWGFCGIQGGTLRYMKLWQPVAWSFSTGGSNNIHIHDNRILAISSTNSIAYNTDGFDVQGTNQLFEYNAVYNRDDCFAISSPSINITVRNTWCNGGYGLSIGGLGANGEVSNVQNILFENAVMENLVYGANFKSFAGGKGTARNITWRGITLRNVQLPIFVTQNYWDQDNGPMPPSSYSSSTSVDTLTFQNFQGTINDVGNGVKDSTGKEVVIFDLYPGTAKSFFVSNVSTTTLSGSQVMAMCDPSKISGDVGFKCWDGLFQPTGIEY